jgi:hypothetical protein
MWLTLGDALPVEVGHLLDQVVVLQQNRAVGSDRQRVPSLGTGMPASVVVGLCCALFIVIPFRGGLKFVD